MYVVLEYDRLGRVPTVWRGEVFDSKDDADGFAEEQNAMCRFVGRAKRFRVASLAPQHATV